MGTTARGSTAILLGCPTPDPWWAPVTSQDRGVRDRELQASRAAANKGRQGSTLKFANARPHADPETAALGAMLVIAFAPPN